MPIAYKTSQPTKRALRKDNLVLVTDGNQSLGPTSTTGYYNSPQPPEGGYAIYSLGTNNNPNIMIAMSDNDLIKAANTLGGDVSSRADAIEYLSNRPSTFILGSMPNNIVTNNLVLSLDATNLTSYPETGNKWNDLSGNAYTGSVSSSAQFNSNGWFEFPGKHTDGEIEIQDLTVNTNSDEGNTVEQWIYQESNNSSTMPFTWWQAYDLWHTGDNFGINTGGGDVYGISGANSVLVGKWNHVVAYFPNNYSTNYTNSKMWINGVAQTMSHRQGTRHNRSLGANQHCAVGGGFTNGGDGYTWDGNVATTRIYSKELSTSEVLQNYYGAPNVPSGAKIILNRSQVGITLKDNGWGFDLANQYSNLQTYGYNDSDLGTDFDGLTAFTYCLWLHCYSHHTSYSQSPFNKYSGTGTAVIRLYDFGNYNGNGDNGDLGFYLNAGGSWTRAGGLTHMDVGETAFVVVQYNSTNGGQLWKNGVKVSSRSASGTIATNSANFNIVTSEYSSEQYTKVKEAYVYTTELTDQQIIDLYNSTKHKYIR